MVLDWLPAAGITGFGTLLIASVFGGVYGARNRKRRIARHMLRQGHKALNPRTVSALEGGLLDALRAAPGKLQLASEGITDVEPIKDGSAASSLAFVCQIRGMEVTVFNFRTPGSSRSRGHSAGVPYKVAKIRHAGLPRFSLGRHGGIDKFERFVDKLLGEPDQRLRAGAPAPFLREYWLKGPDRPAILAFLSRERLTYLQDRDLEGTLASNGAYVVYSERGSLRSEADYDRFLSAVDELLAHLL